MKVVQINGVSSSGSTGKIVTQLSIVMRENNIENYIISSGYKEKTKADNVYFCSSNIGVKLHQTFGVLCGNSGFHSPIATYKTISFIKKTKPDVVHLHNIYSYFLNVEKLLLYLKKSGIPVVWTMHDFWAITGHCTHFESVGCDKWKTQCGKCPQKNLFPYSKFFDRSKSLHKKKRKIFQGWDNLHIVTVSNWVKSRVEQSYLADKSITPIYNGIDLNTFRKKQVNRPTWMKGKFVILGVSMGWNSKKGLDDFVKLSQKLDDDEIIMLIGLTDKQIKVLPDNIIGIKRTASADELCDYYNMADVYVSASVEETMGLTVVEAMACGTPAVVYNKTALPELICDGCGFVCEYGVDCLYEGIQKVRQKMKTDFSDKCVSFVSKNFDKQNQYEKYCDLYKEIVGINNSEARLK